MSFSTNNPAVQLAAPHIERVRHELKLRELQVTAVEQLTPHMRRITLGGAALADFNSPCADDHVKVFVPGTTERRDYTPRAYDREQQRLVLDFVVHAGGAAASWAAQAQVGDMINIGGPRGSQVLHGTIPNWLLIGDETALPAIGRRIESLQAIQQVTSIVCVPSAADEQTFSSVATINTHWVHRALSQAQDPTPVLAALQDLVIAPNTFVWLAGEAAMVKAVRQYLLAERQVPSAWLKAAGYWKQGQADSHERF